MNKKITEEQLQERQAFLDAYEDFYRWLKSIGYRPRDVWLRNYRAFDYFSEERIGFKKHSDVDEWTNDIFHTRIMFVLDDERHWWIFVDSCAYTKWRSLEVMKQEIRDEIIKKREEINSIPL